MRRTLRCALWAAAVATTAAWLCASAGAGSGSVSFVGLPSQVYEGQTVTFTVNTSTSKSVTCSLTIRYSGNHVERVTHVGKRGEASWRVRVPNVPPGSAQLSAVCTGIGSATGHVLVQLAVQTPKLTVDKQGFTEAFNTYPPMNGRVSYGLAIRNERTRFDATNVQFLVNFVDAANHVVGTDHVSIGRIPSDSTVYHGGHVDLQYGPSDPVSRLEVVLVSATSAQKALSTPLLISDVQALPNNQTPPTVGSVGGQVLNQSTLDLQRADVGVVILDAAGQVIGGGTGFAQGPLSKGSREFFSSCCTYSDIAPEDVATILVSAVPTYPSNPQQAGPLP